MDNKLNVNKVDDIDLVRQRMDSLTDGGLALQADNENRKTLELKNQALSQKKSFGKSYFFCLTEIKAQAVNGYFVTEGEDIPPIAIGLFEIDEESKSYLDSSEFWESNINNPIKIQFLTDYTDEMMLSLYHLATIHFEKKQYPDCIQIYTFLNLMNPEIASFLMGLGLAYELNDELGAAMETYEKAMSTEPLKFDPYIGLIRCSEKLKSFDNITIHLKKATAIKELEEGAKAALEYLSSLQKVG